MPRMVAIILFVGYCCPVLVYWRVCCAHDTIFKMWGTSILTSLPRRFFVVVLHHFPHFRGWPPTHHVGISVYDRGLPDIGCPLDP